MLPAWDLLLKKKGVRKRKVFEKCKLPGPVERVVSDKYGVGESCRIPLEKLPKKALKNAKVTAEALRAEPFIVGKVVGIEKRSRLIVFPGNKK